MDLKPYNSNDCQTGFDNFDYNDGYWYISLNISK